MNTDADDEYIDDWEDEDQIQERQCAVIRTLVSIILGYYLKEKLLHTQLTVLTHNIYLPFWRLATLN